MQRACRRIQRTELHRTLAEDHKWPMASSLKLCFRQRSPQFLYVSSFPTLSSPPGNHSRSLLKPIGARSQQGIDPAAMARTLDQIDSVPVMHFENIGYCVSGNLLHGPITTGLSER